jgi:UDP-GlcNAc:undecaprenyl-phosphate/decaprenyl-phosphate GlcNAc-1-phosphate transferase
LSRADGRHIHHQILALGLSATRTVLLLGLFFVGVAASGILIAFAPPDVTFALGTAAAVLAFVTVIYGTRWLRYSEFTEVGASVASVILNARKHVQRKLQASDVARRITDAKSVEEIRDILRDSAGDLNVLQLELLATKEVSYGPEALRIAPIDGRPWRLEFPITWEANGSTYEAFLRLWCARPRAYQHMGFERVATRLAPAVEQWARNHPEALLDLAIEGNRHELRVMQPRFRRSGEVRASTLRSD